MLYFSADWVFPVSQEPIKNGVVAVTPEGVVTDVFPEETALASGIQGIQYFNGAIVPGFINTHCHLELSHLRAKIPEHTGLIPFIKGILSIREAEETEIIAAAKAADREMYGNGIVAVGDIANRSVTAGVKENSKLFYHTFLEVFGFRQSAIEIMEAASEVRKGFGSLRTSVVPHAPYSVSHDLFAAIRGLTEHEENLISIHNQETAAENEYFEKRTGAFIDFYRHIGMEPDNVPPAGKTSLQYYLPLLSKEQKVLLVHNTVSGSADVKFATNTHKNIYWCLCPNANLYIENALPDVGMLAREGARITLGTDSLASNHRLNIADEMRVLQIRKQVDFELLLQWATLNGAEFLGVADQLGSLEAGKKPGLNLLNLDESFTLTDSKVTRLI